MKKTRLKPTLLRAVMIFLITIIGSGLIVGFYYAQSWLNDVSIGVNTVDPSQGSNLSNPQSINQLRADISRQKIAADKASSLIILKQDYESQIQKDLNKYALDTGVKISDYKTVSSPASGTIQSQIVGVQTNYVSVAINNPVVYTDLIKFIKAIETNIPKMKLTGMNITSSNKSGTSVSIDPLIIEVYTK